jgi:hypothetical protein
MTEKLKSCETDLVCCSSLQLRCLTWKDKNQQPNSFQNEVFLVWKKCGTNLEANMHDKLLGARKIILLSYRNDAPKNSNLPRSTSQHCFSFCVGNFTPVQTDLLWLELITNHQMLCIPVAPILKPTCMINSLGPGKLYSYLTGMMPQRTATCQDQLHNIASVFVSEISHPFRPTFCG